MKKQIERAMQPTPRLKQHTFTRASRSWQHVAVLASTGFSPMRGAHTKATGAPTWSNDSSWILRQRLN